MRKIDSEILRENSPLQKSLGTLATLSTKSNIVYLFMNQTFYKKYTKLSRHTLDDIDLLMSKAQQEKVQ